MRYTETQVEQIRVELTEAMNKVLAKYDSKVNIGSITYGETLSAKFTAARTSENEHGEYTNTKEAIEFKRRAKGLGLKENVLNEKCHYKGDVYVVQGYKSRSRKYPIMFRKNGDPYVASVEFMKTFVRAERPELFL